MSLALLGCGTVGTTLGLRLRKAGYPLRIHDTERCNATRLIEAGAEWVAELSSLALGCGLIVSALPGPRELEATLLGGGGPWGAAAPRTIHVETSTVGPDFVRRLATAARSHDVRLLDGPISRGAAGNAGATLVMFAAGDANYFDLARPALEVMVERIVFCGSVGQGQIAKLVNNLVTHSLTVLVGEALALGVRAGASLDILHSALHHGTGYTRLLDEMLPASALRGDWRAGLKLDLARKDLDLAVDLATEHDVRLTAIDSVQDLYGEAARRGWGELSAHAVIRLIEESFGVELRSQIFQAITPP